MTAFKDLEPFAFQIRGAAGFNDIETKGAAFNTPLGEFNAAANDLGKEWITEHIPARFVFLVQE